MNPIANDLKASIELLTEDFGACTHKQQLPGDASNRKYFRLIFENKLKTILMLIYEEKGPIQGEISAQTCAPTPSTQFIEVQKFLKSNQIRVPNILAQRENPKLILLEDLGDDLLFEIIRNNPHEILCYYKKALQQLSSLAQASEQLDSSSFIKTRSFDQKLWQGEFEHFVECAIDVHLNLSQTHRQNIIDAFQDLSHKLASYPKKLCHRDYHARNLIYLKDEQQFAIIDFQDALMAPIAYDIASLLRDAYIEIPTQQRYQLVQYAYECSKEKNCLPLGQSYDQFQYIFDLIATHRNLKAAGRFFYIDQVKGNPNFLKDIPLCLKYVHETLCKYSELKTLKTLLEAPILELLQRKDLYKA